MDGTTPILEIRHLDNARRGEWDAFVDGCLEATFFHRSGWKDVIERSFGHRCYFLFAESQGIIRGILPLVHINSRLFGRSLVSSGFSVYGGPVALDAHTRHALDSEALRLAEQLNVDCLEYRLRAPAHTDWACKSELYVTFRKDLDPDPEKNLLAIPRKQRAMVRKGIKLGLEGEIDQTTDRFFALYAESVRNLGTPVFSRKFFRTLKDVFGPDCEILTVVHDGQAVAGVMSFLFRDEVLPYYGGGGIAARAVAGNDFMYWDVMRRACERGARVFDFGRSKRGTGSFSFKKHWGFEAVPLHYEYKLVRGREIPEINPTNPKYQALISMWRRLPLPVANFLGPFISRDLA
jgi:FemAB-related protein (PEP-CTERM system-associated)